MCSSDLPTYNEKENIENIIRAVFGLEKVFHILVIDDGSPDGTAAIVKGLQKEFPERLFIVERKGKLGLGTAYIRGFPGSRNPPAAPGSRRRFPDTPGCRRRTAA